MSHITERALQASLKNMLLKKPLNKITINDLAEDCGVSRMTFYYHFKDIYDLLEWSCTEDVSKALTESASSSWQEKMLRILNTMQQNEPFIANVYHCIDRERLERYLHKTTYSLLRGFIEKEAQNLPRNKEKQPFETNRSCRIVEEDDYTFIARFYTYAFTGLVLDWVKSGMDEDPGCLVHRLSPLMQGALPRAVGACRTDAMHQTAMSD